MINVFSVSTAYAEEAAASSTTSTIVSILPFAVLIVIFYFLLIRPQQKAAKEHTKMVESIQVGDRVITRGGIHGTIAGVKEDGFMVEVAEGVKIKVEKGAIQVRKAK